MTIFCDFQKIFNVPHDQTFSPFCLFQNKRNLSAQISLRNELNIFPTPCGLFGRPCILFILTVHTYRMGKLYIIVFFFIIICSLNSFCLVILSSLIFLFVYAFGDTIPIFQIFAGKWMSWNKMEFNRKSKILLTRWNIWWYNICRNIWKCSYVIKFSFLFIFHR